MEIRRLKQDKPVVIPSLKPRNPFGLTRKGTIRHKDKRSQLDKLNRLKEKETYNE